MKRKLWKPIYECRCNERLQTKKFMRLAHTGWHIKLQRKSCAAYVHGHFFFLSNQDPFCIFRRASTSARLRARQRRSPCEMALESMAATGEESSDDCPKVCSWFACHLWARSREVVTHSTMIACECRGNLQHECPRVSQSFGSRKFSRRILGNSIWGTKLFSNTIRVLGGVLDRQSCNDCARMCSIRAQSAQMCQDSYRMCQDVRILAHLCCCVVVLLC